MNKFIEKYFKEPYINVLCVELNVDLPSYKKRRNRNLVLSIIIGALLILAAIILKSIMLVVVALFTIYYGYRLEYLKVKKMEQRTKDKLKMLYPVFVQTFISLLYTNDNLIKVFLILESYHFDPYIDRSIIILINKYQLNPENNEIIFAEFCNIFNTSSASLLHQLLVNISEFGVNDDEINLLEHKINQEYDDYIKKTTFEKRKSLMQYGNIAITMFMVFCLVAVIIAI